MKKSVLVYSILSIVTLFFFSSCSEKKSSVKNDESFNYSTYIFHHTNGIKSVKSDISVVLAQISEIDTSSLEKVLTFSPKIDGELQLLNQKELVFSPKEKLKSNTTYTVTVHLNRLFPNQKENVKDYGFTFKTKKQDFEIKTQALQSYSQDWQYVEGVVKTNDVTSLDKIKQVLSATQNKKELSIKFEEINIETNTFLFKIDSIYRELDDSKIHLNYNGAALNIDKKETRTIDIIGKNNFKVIDVKVVNDADQYVEINFSDPLASNQNLKGLISIQNQPKLTYTIAGNVVKVYPPNTLKGEYYVSIYRGIKNTYGYKFDNTISRTLSFDEPKPLVKFSKSGNILPNSQGLNIQFEAISLKAVDVTIYKIFESNVLQFLQQNNLQGDQNIKMVARPVVKKTIPLHPINNETSKWQTYGIALDKLINVEKGAIYKVKINFNKSYATYKCENNTTTNSTPIEKETFDDAIEDSNWDGYENYYNEYNYYGNYNWRERDDPCTDSYYRNKTVSKNILATDIGLTVKKGNDNSYFVATSNLVSSEPMANVNIQFYNFQQQLLTSTTTNEEGICLLELKSVPFFVTAKKEGQTTYTKVNDGNVLSMSNFNTNGVQPLKGIKGFIYNERGVWRPGDTIFTGFMLNDLKNKLPENHPITIEVKDPNGVLKYRKVENQHLNYLYTFKIPTQDTDPTGRWNATIQIGGASFQKSLKVETIKPNRLKINVTTKNEVLSNHNQIYIAAKWLHGAIAKELKVETDLTLKPQTTHFERYPSYVFDDPSKKFESEQINVLTSKLNADGKINFALKPTTNNNAPGMLKAYLTTRVYENGGDFSTDVYSKTYAPFDTYVGVKRPEGDKARNMLLTDKQHNFEVVCVDVDGKPIANQTVAVTIYKMQNSWWWNNNNNYSQFSSSNFKTPVFNKILKTQNNGKNNFNFEIKYPEWGRYFVKITHQKSGHSTGETVFIDWPGWAGKAKKGNQKEAAMLVFTTDKETYQVNDEVVVNFPSSENGNALITIENNAKVLKYHRIKTSKESTQFKFSVDKSMTPNVYISITTLQAHHNTKNDLPIRMYGVKNISVEDASTHLAPILTAPKEVEPEKEFTLKVAEQNGKPFTYTVAIVDEGLLDLTRFKTPNPWNYFNAKEALGVKTWDMYDDVIGAFGGKLNQVFSIGGDQDLGAAKTQKANRFKPVVIFKGPFSLDANKSNTHKITLPKYIGAVKAMVVAHHLDHEAYGETDASILVKKPLMLLASAPRKVSTNEKIKIPVTVFNALGGNQKVNVHVQSNEVFSVEGNATKTVDFDASGDEIAYFDLKVLKSGFGKINITATNKSHKASYEIEMNAFNPISKVTKTLELIVKNNESEKIELDGFGVDDSNKGTLEVSSFPQINFTNRLKYLIRYPHGCLEQTVSAAFPQLYINHLFETTPSEKNNIAQNINGAIQKLKDFQLLSGGFSYWPGSFKTNDWVSNYAGHFLIEAEKQGYLLPYNFKNNWIAYQKDVSRTWKKTKYNSYLEQAYRLYTLALAQSPELSIMNRLREDRELSNIAKLRLALAYAIIGQKDAAMELMHNASLVDYQQVYQVNHGSTLINKSIALQTYQALDQKSKAISLLQDISKELNSETYLSTQTTAKSLLAVANYYQSVKGNDIKAVLKSNGKKTKIKTDSNFYQQDLALNKGENTLQFENDGQNTLYLKITNEGIPEINKEEELSKNLVSKVTYVDGTGKKIEIQNLPQGTSFTAQIELKNTYNKDVKDIALTYQIPSGWEIINTRYAMDDTSKENNVEYTDIRDNLVHYYFDLKQNERKLFKIKINTTYLGSYYLPGVHAEAMYDNEFLSHTKGQWINVIP